MRRELLLSGAIGCVIGVLTALAVYSLYPPGRGATWPIPAVGVGSLLVLGALYAVSARVMGLRAGDWLVLGYLLAVLVGSVLVMGGEAVSLWRVLVASNVGF